MATTEKPEVLASLPPLESFASEDAKVDQMTENYMRDHYAKQPKVQVKCREDQWVQVNGYTFIIKGGEKVMVPKDIAELLEASGRI